MPIDWLSKMAERERQRREDERIIRRSVGEFQKALTDQINNDLAVYSKHFPKERQFIELEPQAATGSHVIRRVRDASSVYDGVLPTVETHIEFRELLLVCKFKPFERLNQEFKLVSDENGKVGLAEGSIEELSEYLLGPILFDKLADWV